MFKTKINRILPFWLIALFCVITFQVVAALAKTGPLPPAPVALAEFTELKPEVLGAFTTENLRGELQLEETVGLKQVGPINFSDISAKSFLAYDLATGQILAQKDISSPLPIASLTKLVTAMVVYEQTTLDEVVTIGDNLIAIRPILGLLPGDKIKVGDLFNAMLVGSSNDAAQALSEYVTEKTGSNFIKLMNQKSGQLGMSSSNFSNPLGFDSKFNYSTAEDLKNLVNASQSLSAFKLLGKKTSYTFTSQNGHRYSTVATNKLLEKYPELESVKTGHTENSQGSIITKLNIAGHEVIIIVIGSTSRESDTVKLKDRIAAGWEWK